MLSGLEILKIIFLVNSAIHANIWNIIYIEPNIIVKGLEANFGIGSFGTPVGILIWVIGLSLEVQLAMRLIQREI